MALENQSRERRIIDERVTRALQGLDGIIAGTLRVVGHILQNAT